MMFKTNRITIRLARLGYCLGGILLAAGMILSLMPSPVRAADVSTPAQQEAPQTEEPQPILTEAPQEPPTTEEPQDPPAETPTAAPACTPPENFDGTIRLFYSRTASKEWHFEVDEPEMNVTLVFFYFQDYDRNGCPFDCATGECQTDEVGEGETPLGSFSISDGQKGANDGKEKLSGRLSKGSYTASFHVTGKGSINIGMRVQKDSVPPTSTPATPPPSPTPTQPASTPTTTQPVGIPTATILPPGGTPTATLTLETATPTEPPDRPRKTPKDTPTPPPATLAPPTPPPGTAVSPALVPVTGGDGNTPAGPLARHQGLLVTLGIGLLGLGLIFHTVSRRLYDL